VSGAFLYLTGCSLKNRALGRLRRLREPRYLAGLAAGVAYLYLVFFRNQMSSARHRGDGLAAIASFAPDIGAAGALALWAMAVVAWLWPFGTRAWTFNGAEVNLLVTAPVTRRALINYKMLRAQLGLLFGVAIAALFSGAARGAASGRWSFALGGWLVLAAFYLYALGVNLTKACFRAPASRIPWLAWASAAVMLIVSGAVVGTLAAHAAAVVSKPVGEALRGLLDASRTGVAAVALWPFAAVVAPVLAARPAAFAMALVPALAVVAVNYWWVVASDAQLAGTAAAVEQAQVSGQRGQRAPVMRAAPFTLAPVGRPETAVLWKNTIQFGRYASVAVVVRVLIPIVVLAGVVGLNRRGGSLAPVVLTVAFFTTLIGPYIVRNDLRTDLPRLPVLKTWPISGRELLLGEVLAPVLVLSGIVWLLLAVVFALWPSWRVGPGDLAGRTAVAMAAAVLAPVLIAGQIILQNAAVVLFPGWIVTGGARARGIEAMGQNMLMMAGTLLSLAIGVLPAAAAAGGLGGLLYFVIGWPGVVPAAVVFAGILLLEAALVLAWLGRVLERTDPSQVETAEWAAATGQWP
jgi:ABC-2 type transport system permease protein